MRKTETTDYIVCTECFLVTFASDVTFLDYSYDEPEATERLIQIANGQEDLVEGEGHFAYVSDEEAWFSHGSCECCGSTLAGDRRTMRWVQFMPEETETESCTA